jgi:hypothetical protein
MYYTVHVYNFLNILPFIQYFKEIFGEYLTADIDNSDLELC